MLHDPYFHRDLALRAGWTLMAAAIGYFILGIDARIWLLPVGGVLLVLIRWVSRSRAMADGDERDDDDANPIN
jgi:hypothetical protein